MRFASHHSPIAVAVCVLLALAGCKGTIMPQLYHPGTAGYQRYNALQYDPYPLDDVAPTVVGARPREYERPIPEVKRGQAFTKRPTPPPIAMPSFAPSSTPVFTAPPALPGATASPFAPPPTVPYQQTMPPVLPSAPSRPPY